MKNREKELTNILLHQTKGTSPSMPYGFTTTNVFNLLTEFAFYNLITLQNPTKEASRILQIQQIAKQLLTSQVVFFY